VPRLIAESLALLLLVATLGSAVVRPRGLPEAVVAVPAAALLLVLGALPLAQAKTEAKSLAPTIGFLAAVLVLADLCERYGLFDAAGRWIAAGSRGRPDALLGLVFAVASLVTAVLSLDATVVLLTPVVFATVARVRLRAKPYVLRVHAPGELSVAAPAGLEPHQPSRVPSERALVRAIRGDDGAAVGCGHRRRVGRAAQVLLCGSRRAWRPSHRDSNTRSGLRARSWSKEPGRAASMRLQGSSPQERRSPYFT
jgi:hypothetical protein